MTLHLPMKGLEGTAAWNRTVIKAFPEGIL
jgi:hypothetical protein